MFFNNHTLLALYATLFTWLLTTLGSAMVFAVKKVNNDFIKNMLGLSAGIMLSASFWSLLMPAVKASSNFKIAPWIIITTGFSLGFLFIYVLDKIFGNKIQKYDKNISLLILSITLHNIPEGLAIGIAFGSINKIGLKSAWLLALGIGLQNFPEGSAISLPLKKYERSNFKCFIVGSLSAIVEPIFGVIGAILTIKLTNIMPILLSFAAGAMIYVVVKEIIPESQKTSNSIKVTIYTMIGFLIMMILDISL